ncbi:MAG: hypothetical protein KAV82_01305 [Phycisphaerae bacterium]|nr:hypothetical protein [Phycisphaerae bacterium]
MGKTLDALRHLQELELKLGDLIREEESKRRQIRMLERQLQKNNQELEDQQNTIRHHEVEIHSLELDISSREETIQKHRVALNTTKTNKDYAAVLSTINTEKADTSKLENRVLELMSVKDSLQSACDEKTAGRDKIQERQAHAEAKLKAYLERTHEQRVELTHQRKEASQALPPTVMNTFDRAAERLEGEALAMIRKVNPKRDEYVCEGCNMSVTLETINSLRTRDEVVLCNSCGRILFLAD